MIQRLYLARVSTFCPNWKPALHQKRNKSEAWPQGPCRVNENFEEPETPAEDSLILKAGVRDRTRALHRVRSHSSHNRDPQPKPDRENTKHPKENENKKEGEKIMKKKGKHFIQLVRCKSCLILVTLTVPKVELYYKPGTFVIYFSVIENK